MANRRLERKLLSRLAKASADFSLLEEGDRVLVALSGGKDSYALMRLLDLTRKKAPFSFELIAVNLDQGHPGFEQNIITQWCESNGYAHHMLHVDTLTIVKSKIPEGNTYCSLCSRLRRGVLYNAAVKLNCNKIALGHHRDDIIETLMLNLMFSGQLKTMPARLTSDDGRNVVIRPLAYCDEADIIAYSEEHQFPILPCNLCGSQANMQRQNIKAMLNDWNRKNPAIKSNIFAAIGNVRPSHLFDRELAALAGVTHLRATDEYVL